jgi:hypothetical protein
MKRTGKPSGSPPSRTVSVRPSDVVTDRIERVYAERSVRTGRVVWARQENRGLRFSRRINSGRFELNGRRSGHADSARQVALVTLASLVVAALTGGNGWSV